MMKKIFIFLLVLCSAITTMAQNDTTKYTPVFGYGNNFNRVKAKLALVFPSDTTQNKLPGCIAVINGVAYVKETSAWVAIGANALDTAALLSSVVRTFGTQSVAGAKTYTDSATFNKAFAAYNSLAIFGTGAATVRIGYGANSGESQIKIGDSFLFKRNGTSEPIIQSIGRGMLLYSHGLSVYGDSISSTYAPGKLRLAGNYGFGVAHFGAYNTATSVMYFGNESTTSSVYTNEMTVYGRNNRWMINDTSTVPTYQASSIFTLQSTKKGFLLPRMTTTQRDAISSPATGLEVYNTTTNRKNVYNGSAWVELATSTDLGSYLPLAGGTLTGTLNGTAASFSGNVAIGGFANFGGSSGGANRIFYSGTEFFVRSDFDTLKLQGGADNGSPRDIVFSIGTTRRVWIPRDTRVLTADYTLTLTDNNNAFATTAFVKGQGYVVNTTTVAGFPLSSNVTLATLTLGRGLTGTSYNGSAAVTARLDTTGSYTWTGTNTFNEPLRGFFNGDTYAYFFNPAGDGTFANGAISWSSSGVFTSLVSNSISTNGNGVNFTVNSANSNLYKMLFRDNGTDRAYYGADGTDAFIIANGSITTVAKVNATTGAYTAVSDSAAKKNIINSTTALPLINQIKIRQYDWKGSNLHEPFGVIAQELFNVAPTYVSKPADSTGRWGVQKAEMVPLALKGIQELYNEVQQLKQQVQQLLHPSATIFRHTPSIQYFTKQ